MTGVWSFIAAGAVCVGLAVSSPSSPARQQIRDAAGTPTPETQKAALLAGRVIDAATDARPVRRAIVTVSGVTIPAGRSAVTDDEGRFGFSGLEPGDYTVKAVRPAYLANAFGATRPGRAGIPVTLVAGQQVTDVTVVMPRGSAIEGVLRDIAGDTAPGMRVEAIRLFRNALGERGERAGVAFTDDRGIYRIFGLPQGDYVLVATPATVVGGLGEIGAPTEAEVDAIFARLQRGGAAAAPAANPALPSKPTEPPAAASTRRGYSTPATYYPGVISSADAVRLTLGPGDERTGVDFGMKLGSAATVSGTLVSQMQPLPSLTVQIRPFGPELPVFGGSISAAPSVTHNRGDGTFRIANVPPGRYRIVARSIGAPGAPAGTIASGGALPPPGADGGPVLWAETDIQVTGDDLAGVTLTLHSAPRFAGRLAVGAASSKPPLPASTRIQLEPVTPPHEPSNGLTAALTAPVRPDGTFEFAAVIPGAYRMTVMTAPGWWARSADWASRDLLDELIQVRSDSITGVSVTLSDRRPAITGTLSTPAGRPASGYFVVAFPAERTSWRWPSRRIVSTRPATNGVFELQDLAPGEYRLVVLTDLEQADLGDPSFLEALLPAALTVVVAEGERKTQHLRIGG